MNRFGTRVRELRQQRNLPLRVVSAYLDMDPAILSKIERGLRKASREQVKNLAAYFNTDEHALMTDWYADRIMYELPCDQTGLEALRIAEQEVAYIVSAKQDRNQIIRLIKKFLRKDGRVRKAWIFGSFARGEDTPSSDIDMMVSYSDKAAGTLLDHADLQFGLQRLLKRRIDLVEEGFVKPFAWKRIKPELLLIYDGTS